MDGIQHNILTRHYVFKDAWTQNFIKHRAASLRVQLPEYQTTGSRNKTAKYWSQQKSRVGGGSLKGEGQQGGQRSYLHARLHDVGRNIHRSFTAVGHSIHFVLYFLHCGCYAYRPPLHPELYTSPTQCVCLPTMTLNKQRFYP